MLTQETVQTALPDENFIRFRNLIAERIGLQFHDHQRGTIEKAILDSGAVRQGDTLDAYYQRLKSTSTQNAQWDKLIARLTIGETYFFRNTSHTAALRDEILPRLIIRHRHHRRLRLWSAGCASGEEAYTLAMLLCELLPDIKSWNILISGTDINKSTLDFARQGRYRPWSLRQTNDIQRKRYFSVDDETFVLDPEIQQMVTFQYQNLAEDSYPSDMDLILCRNVAIYLPENVNRVIAGRFYHSLAPGGYLIMGASETNTQMFSQFQSEVLEGATIYKKNDQLAPAPTTKSLPQFPQSIPSPKPISTPAVSLRAPETAHLDSPPPTADDLYQLACEYINQGQLAQANTYCQLALEKAPASIEIRYALALILQKQGDLDQAIAHLKQVLYLAPDFILAHFMLASYYQKIGLIEKLTRHRQQILRLVSKLAPDEKIPGSEELNAARLLDMVNAMV